MKSIIRGVAAAAICVAACLPLSADYWMVSNNPLTVQRGTTVTNGVVNWQPATGNLATLAPGETLLSVMRGGSDVLSRPVVLVGGAHGLYRSVDNGLTWFVVSNPGSGLEATSKYFSAIVTSPTNAGTTDLLVGAVGTSNGGVYLSGDDGLHWTQINQGFDPSNLNITTLVKTSCSGCPVQYYSGTYGSGVYTRTIAVNYPPVITGWCFGSTTCTCGTSAPLSGFAGQAFRLCGANFLPLPSVQFGWLGLSPNEGINASGCMATANVITCTAAPASVCGGISGGTPYGSGPAWISVRNTDTRSGLMPVKYNY